MCSNGHLIAFATGLPTDHFGKVFWNSSQSALVLLPDSKNEDLLGLIFGLCCFYPNIQYPKWDIFIQYPKWDIASQRSI